MNSKDVIWLTVFFSYLMIFLAAEPSVAAGLAVVSPFGLPLRGVVFEKAGDEGAGGGDGSDGPDPAAGGHGPDPKPGGEGEGPKGIDAEIEEAMRLTDQVSDPDYEEDEPGSGEGPSSAAAPEAGENEKPGDGGEPGSGDEPGTTEASEDKEDIEYVDEYDPNDVVEIEGSTYFYHPKEHNKDGKHGNVYRSRDDAEMAWTHKVARIQELSEKLNDLGKGIGPVDLPEWYSDPDNPESLQAKADIDEAIQMPNKDLRDRLAEGDDLITYLDERVKRVDSEAQTEKLSQDLESRIEEAYETVDPLIDELSLEDAVKSAKTTADLRKAAATAVEKKINADVKALEKEYSDYKNNADARMDDDDYPEKLERKRDAVRDKRRELEQKYKTQFLSPFDKMIEVEKEVAEFQEKKKESSGVSEKERLKQQNDAFMDFQSEMLDKHHIFMATDMKGVKAFRDWAVNRAEKFGGLKNSYQWGKAIREYDKKLEQRRAEVRRKKIEADNKKDSRAGDKPHIPGYGDQKKLRKKDNLSAREKLDAEMEELMEETDARVG